MRETIIPALHEKHPKWDHQTLKAKASAIADIYIRNQLVNPPTSEQIKEAEERFKAETSMTDEEVQQLRESDDRRFRQFMLTNAMPEGDSIRADPSSRMLDTSIRGEFSDFMADDHPADEDGHTEAGESAQ